MVFDIREALKRAGCCNDNPDDFTYKNKFVINYYSIERLRESILNKLLQDHNNKIELIKKLSFEDLSIIKNSKKDIRILSFKELLDVINSGLIGEEINTRFYPDGSFDIMFNSPSKTVLDDITNKNYIEDFNNSNVDNFFVVDTLNKEVLKNKKPSANTDNITDDQINNAKRKEIDSKNADSILQAEDEMIIEKLCKETDRFGTGRFYRNSDVGNPFKKERQLVDAADFIRKATLDGYQRDGYQMPPCFYNPSTKDIYTATEPKNPFDLPIDFSTADNKSRKNFLKHLVKKDDSLHIFGVTSTDDVYEARTPQNDYDINLDCFKLIFGKDTFSFVKNNWAYFKKDYLKTMDKRDYSEINRKDNKILKDGENLTVELALERSGFNKDCTVKKENVKLNNVMVCGDGVTKKNAPLKFDTGPFDTSAALKRAGVNQSKEEIEDIKKKISYQFDTFKLNTKEDGFIENRILDNIDDGYFIKPARRLEDIKEAREENSNKLAKEFNDACELFNSTIKPLPSFNIKSKRGIYSVSQNNDNISEVEIMAASKLPKVEKEPVRPLENVEKNISNKSIDQTIKEVTVKLKKFTYTVKSAFQELIK